MKTSITLLLTLIFCLTGLSHAQESSAVRLKRGDQLEIEIYNHEDMKAIVPVEATGEASFRFLDPIKVEGKTLKEVKDIVNKLYKPDYFINPEITLRITDMAQGKVEVLGAVVNPKPIILERGDKLSITKAVAAAGGVTAIADKSNIILRSQNKAPKRYNLNILERKGAEQVFLKDGDSIEVKVNPNAGKTVTIMGYIVNPGSVPYPLDGIDLDTLIGLSGGVKPGGMKERATIKRNGKVFGNRGMRTKLKPGDVVNIPLNPNVGKFVIMAGRITNPGKLAIPLNGQLTVSAAVAQSGGKSNLGDIRNIIITRGNQKIEVNLKKIRTGKAGKVFLKHKDTVTVGERIF